MATGFDIAYAKLPRFAKGLAKHAHTVVALRDAVIQKLEAYGLDENPLTEKQVVALRLFLKRIQ